MNKAISDLLPKLERWFGEIMAQVMSMPPIRGDGVLMLGAAVWGKKYADRFQSYALPSIVAKRNFDALKGRCHFVVFTDAATFARIWGLCRTLEGGGITTQILVIPDYIMAEQHRDPLNRYWFLGVTGNALLQMAGRTGMGMHWTFPDHLYGHSYFENLQRLVAAGHKAIVQPGISANIETAWEAIEPFRNEDGNLAIPDVELGTIGWQHLHPQTRASLMNRATISTAMPNSHLLVWQGRDKIVLHCCHMNPAYLAPEIVAKAPTRIPATLDAELPAFLAGAPFYVPTITDGMTYLELSDGEKRVVDKFVPFDEFSERCWTHVRFLDEWMPYFRAPFAIPMHPQETGIEDADIKGEFAEVYEMLMRDKARAAIAFIPKLAFQSPEA